MLAGTITSRHIVLHPLRIIRGFGLRTWCRAMRRVLSRKTYTFLDCVW
jgi:hypothetical protein